MELCDVFRDYGLKRLCGDIETGMEEGSRNKREARIMEKMDEILGMIEEYIKKANAKIYKG